MLSRRTAEQAKTSELRFRFGENWRSFLDVLNEQRVLEAQKSLQSMFGVERMVGKRFLDIGSGSGVFSLAARRLGAFVYSFDYDPDSVKCAHELRRLFNEDSSMWRVEEGSVLDRTYLSRLGQFDFVYCWGVLHHTGDMWQGLENIVPCVRHEGRLFIAIYNDQGWISGYWRQVKRMYNRGPVLRNLVTCIHAPYLVGGRLLARSLSGRLALERGMSLWHDMRDWLGGWPFEVATPAEVVEFARQRGLSLVVGRTCGRRHGCNEFVFARTAVL